MARGIHLALAAMAARAGHSAAAAVMSPADRAAGSVHLADPGTVPAPVRAHDRSGRAGADLDQARTASARVHADSARAQARISPGDPQGLRAAAARDCRWALDSIADRLSATRHFHETDLDAAASAADSIGDSIAILIEDSAADSGVDSDAGAAALADLDGASAGEPV